MHLIVLYLKVGYVPLNNSDHWGSNLITVQMGSKTRLLTFLVRSCNNNSHSIIKCIVDGQTSLSEEVPVPHRLVERPDCG